ncbi:hypothetical protein [Aneurinibacillus aneurinilyticus]|uniref:hypothetical protein n=1 Tax=Aneurinibacillus aneurinilyticus TaxID=1391 RepID=UPI00058BB6C1|nr:hypothetical protein [Aneurinibacillus aneurinilyticus]MED0706302.1 hypothetical protein [Aneurinibacillus aneurinilyticus]MED0725286.1 hypothetical protein [Aneurinibacillus aneurinilyticus]MED0732300.1 hypothetical protein [Aneurinibacillus aneurinilyticus]MED0741472.1 hypothetical protein [Aneurinibacillus aneurinilyticus]
MSKQLIGKFLIILGFVLMMVKAVFFQSYEFRYIFTLISFGLCLIGFMLVPNYPTKKDAKQESI